MKLAEKKASNLGTWCSTYWLANMLAVQISILECLLREIHKTSFWIRVVCCYRHLYDGCVGNVLHQHVTWRRSQFLAWKPETCLPTPTNYLRRKVGLDLLRWELITLWERCDGPIQFLLRGDRQRRGHACNLSAVEVNLFARNLSESVKTCPILKCK